MRNLLLFLLAAGLFLTGCSSSHQLMEPASARNRSTGKEPAFLDDVSLRGNNARGKIGNPTVRDMHHEVHHDMISSLQGKYASMLNVFPGALTNLALYNFIEDWYGVKYRFGGNDKSGIDCSAFVKQLYEDVFCTSILRSAFEQFGMCAKVCNDSLQEGDLVFFRTHGRRISHVGIYLVNNFFVHASTSQGVMISSLDESYWKRNFAGAGKIISK